MRRDNTALDSKVACMFTQKS